MVEAIAPTRVRRKDERSSQTLRHRLAALSSLFEHLCNANTVTHNPVKGVERPVGETY